MNILITAPSLDTSVNVSGISSVASFIIKNNLKHNYIHFKLGKKDNEKRGGTAYFRLVQNWISWAKIMVLERNMFVHFNYALDKRSIIRDTPLVLFSRLMNKRMILHLHGGEYLHKDSIPKWINILLKFTFSANTPIIVLSPIEKQIIVDKFHSGKIIDLPNCIEIKEAKKFHRNLPYCNPVKLLFIGRLVKRKGIEIILQALIILKTKGIEFNFILAGTGSDEIDYVRRCTEVFGPAFDFKGIVSGQEKIELYKQCDIFLLPSLSGEGLPMALLEAMSFGLAPIVTEDGSMKYIIKTEENGILVDKDSPTSLAEAIENLIVNKKLQEKISLNAHQYVFENHDPEIYINALNNFYETA
jgi:glycosyltransferase involved in cell wall biosynthesis